MKFFIRFKNKRYLRHIFSIALLISVFILFVFYYYNTTIMPTKNVPVITFSENIKNEVKVNYTDTDFLKGVTASDVEDGDLTSSIVVEQKSNIFKGNMREIIYAVCDSDNNTTKISREIEYIDYKPPVIEAVSDNPTIKSRKYAEVLSCFRATDVIDGDISNKIQIENIDTSGNNVTNGIFPVTVSVTNSCGDVTTFKQVVNIIEEDDK